MADIPTNRLTIRAPDDFHLHLRDGPGMTSVLADTARQFARAIIMPNLRHPVTTTAAALAYRQRIMAALPGGCPFQPLMTLYLTPGTTRDEILRACDCGHIYAVKFYPAGATTHAEHGVRDLKAVYPLLETLEEVGLPLLVHGEVIDPEVDIFDREAVFIDRQLSPLLDRFDTLRVVLEHITTHEGVDFVRQSPANLAATITPHH